jgi:hypothetical protein
MPSRAQTPVVRFVVIAVDLLWIFCGFVVGPTAQTHMVGFVVDLLWISCTTCCTEVPQQIEQVHAV